jgi:protein transport protein SEC31
VYSIQSDQAAAASQASNIAAIGSNADDPFNLNASALSTATSLMLKTPPKWLRRPVGATFGFGGKLVTFNATSTATTAPGAPNASVASHSHANVSIRTIVTEPTLVARSQELEHAIESKNLHAFCEARQKEAAGNAEEEAAWKIIAVLFDGDARDRLVKILGRDKEHVLSELTSKLETTTISTTEPTANQDAPAVSSTDTAASTDAAPTSASNGDALSGYFPESTAAESDFFSGTSGTSAVYGLGVTDNTTVSTSTAAKDTTTFHILPNDANPVDTLITRAVQLGDFDAAVRACLDADRLADALLLAVCGGNELLARTRQAYFERRANSTPYLRLLRNVIGGNLVDVASHGDLAQWDEILVVLCTYARGEEFSGLCAQLGDRLVEQWHTHKNREARQNAVLCYLAAGDLAKVTQLWIVTELEVEQHGLTQGLLSASSVHALALQSLMEKVAVLRQAIDHVDDAVEAPLDSRTDTAAATAVASDTKFKLSALYNKYCEYAELLASQGELKTAAHYASRTPADYQVKQEDGLDALAIIKDRLRQCGQEVNSVSRPFDVTPIGKSPTVAATTTAYGTTAYGTTAYGITGYNTAGYPAATTAQTSYTDYGSNTTATTGYSTTGYSGYNTTTTGYNQPYGGTAQTTGYGYGSTQPPQPLQPSIPAPTIATMTAATATTGGYGGYTPASHYGNAAVPPLPMGGSITSDVASHSPPTSQRNDIPGWNDPPPMAVPTKRVNPNTAAMAPLTTPFPGANVTHPNMPPTTAGGMPATATPPPPPQNAVAPAPLYARPPSGQQGVSAAIPPPPPQQNPYSMNTTTVQHGQSASISNIGYGAIPPQTAPPPPPAVPVKQRHRK